MRIVIAQVDASLAAGIRGALEAAGWEVDVAATSQELHGACESGADVAVLGAADSGPTGELIAELKRSPASFATAVVVVADRRATGAQDALELLGLGVHDLLLEPFTAADVVARVAAAARSRALVEELVERDRRIEELVFVDELTGLYNRRYLLHQTTTLIAAARRHGHSLGCVLLDIDRFKEINDTHGHPAGDEVLRAVARSIRSRLRTEDVAGRLGGDEFLVLLPETAADGVRTVAEGIRSQIAAGGARADGRFIKVTASVGWVAWRGEDRNDLLQRVDRALYAAKAAGRDRTAAL